MKSAQQGSREELSQKLISGMIRHAADAIISTDSDLRVVLFNSAAEKMFQVRAKAAIGQLLKNFIPERFGGAAQGKNVAESPHTEVGRQTGGLAAVKGLRADGAEFPAEASFSQVEVEGRKFYTVIVRDISERRLIEERLREERQRFLLAVETAQLGTYERDLFTNEIRINHTCREILGVPEGVPPTDVAPQSLHPDDTQRVLTAVARAYDPSVRGVCAAEFRIVRSDGTIRWVAGRGRVVFDDTVSPARPHRFMGVLLDITESKLAEAELLRARRNLSLANTELEGHVQERTAKLHEMIAELEHMSYSMVHDMRAPLRAIQGFGEIIERDPQSHLSEEAHRLVANIRTAAHRMDQLLTDALDYNKAVRSPMPVGKADVLRLLTDLLAAHPEFKPPNAAVTFEGKFPWVIGNEAGLAQCFAELLRNGVKFVEPGKVPQVRVWAERIPNHEGAKLHEPSSRSGKAATESLHGATGNRVRICFQDNGTGIPESGHGRIFDMFQRMHGPEYPGTGIGLALVRKIIEHMGGRVGVESEEGKGSRFWLELPEALPPGQSRHNIQAAALNRKIGLKQRARRSRVAK
jgi:PAS domain S-box-containing protein